MTARRIPPSHSLYDSHFAHAMGLSGNVTAAATLDATSPPAANTATEVVGVCIVAPKHMVGGQAVSAQSLLAGFEDDPACRLELQPIDPPLPPWLAPYRGVRTLTRLPFYFAGLIRRLRRSDVVHIYTAAFWPFALTTTPAILIARAMGKPVLLNYHDGRAAIHLASGWVRWVLRRATVLVFPSEFLREVFKAYGLDGEVISNVVDGERFRFRNRPRLRPALISCRLLEELYAVENTLRAFALIRARYPNAELTIVGLGNREDQLRSIVREEGIDGVTFRGRVSHEQVPDCYDCADVWVNSSREDNMPLSMIEAFSSGLPVVTTGVGGIPHIVQHQRNGLIVGCDAPSELAAAVIRLIEDPGFALRLVAQARSDCEERYGWESAHPKWRSLYQRLVRDSRRG